MHWLSYGKNHLNQQDEYIRTYWRSGSIIRASGLRPGGCGFDPRSSHTKDLQNGNTGMENLWKSIYIQNFHPYTAKPLSVSFLEVPTALAYVILENLFFFFFFLSFCIKIDIENSIANK